MDRHQIIERDNRSRRELDDAFPSVTWAGLAVGAAIAIIVGLV